MPEETKLNLYQKLSKIRKAAAVIQKNKAGYGYKYVTEDEILSRITGLMDKLGVSLIPGIVPGTTEVKPYSYEKTKADKKTGIVTKETVNEILVQADTIYTWVNDENPNERIAVNWALVGQQSDASQSFGSGLSYTFRYFLLKYFDVATVEDDPDSWRSKQREAEDAENRAICEQILKQVDGKVRAYLAENKDKAAEVKKFLSVYVRNGAYMEITDPLIASRLLTDFNTTYGKEQEDA